MQACRHASMCTVVRSGPCVSQSAWVLSQREKRKLGGGKERGARSKGPGSKFSLLAPHRSFLHQRSPFVLIKTKWKEVSFTATKDTLSDTVAVLPPWRPRLFTASSARVAGATPRLDTDRAMSSASMIFFFICISWVLAAMDWLISSPCGFLQWVSKTVLQ